MLVAVVNVFSLIAQQIPNKSLKSHRRSAPKKLFNDNRLQFEDGVLSTTYLKHQYFQDALFQCTTLHQGNILNFIVFFEWKKDHSNEPFKIQLR